MRAVALVLAFSSLGAAGHDPVAAFQTTGLKIVVIAGEDAVNIIQQKTAVNPVVEVRDRNDLPVSGVLVTFTIPAKNATFAGGVQTVTATTNAAGRAAVTSLNPVSSGTYQINVSAASQGQIATATITQTNFATAAAAAAAGASVAAGAGAAAGGGLSGLAITGIAVGAGAAAVVGAKAAGVLGGGDKNPSCTFSVSSTSLSFSSAGGSATINVSWTPSDCEFATRAWTATSNAPFIIVNPAGESTASVFVTINDSGNPPRTGTITVAGHTITITQSARCTVAVSPQNISFPLSGGNATLTITVSPPVCDDPTWRASAGPQTFVSFNPPTGSGSGSTVVSVPPQAITTAQSGVISINNVLVQWTYSGQPVALCSAKREHGSDVPVMRTIDVGRSSGRLLFRFDNGAESPDRLVVSYEGRTLLDTGCVATAGPRTEYLTFSGRATKLNVQVFPNCRGGSGSTWSFEVSCSQ